MGAVISFFRPAATSQGGWSQQELAEFYRVEAALIRAGLQIGSERGLSDEGEPWFAFCRPDGDAIMHFARIDGSYVIASEVLDTPMWGGDFRNLINQIAQRHPELLPIPKGTDGTKLSVHPAALLAALVAAAALSLSPEDAFAEDADHPGDSAVPEREAGQTLQHGAAGAGHPDTADEQDSHRKQFTAIVFAAMVLAADAFASDRAEAATEAGLAFGAQGSAGSAAWEQGSVSASADGAVRVATSGAPLTASAADPAGRGAPGSGTAEPASAIPTQPSGPDPAAAGLGRPAHVHSPAPASLEPEYQASVGAAEAKAGHAAGSSSSSEAGSDADAAPSGTTEAAGQASPSPNATGEPPAQTQTQAQTQVAGHAAPGALPAQPQGIDAPRTEPDHPASAREEDGSGRPDHVSAKNSAGTDAGVSHVANLAADTNPSGKSEGRSESDPHGADGHGAADAASAAHPPGASQAEAGNAGQDHGQAGEGAGKSAEAPGQIAETGADQHGAAGHGAADAAGATQSSGASQAQTGSADLSHAQPDTAVQGAAHANSGASANPGSQTSANLPTEPAPAGASPPVSGAQPASAGQASHAGEQNPATVPPASVDPAGNIVFASDGQHGQGAPPSHTPAEAGVSGEVGLIGVSDHGGAAHHFGLHS